MHIGVVPSAKKKKKNCAVFHSEVLNAANLAMKDLFFKAHRGRGEAEQDSGIR